MKFKNIIVGLLLVSGFLANAQQKKWTLKECVDHALEHNISVKQSTLDKELSEIDKKDAIGNFLPSLNGSASHSWNIGLNQNIITGSLENATTQFSSLGLNAGVDIFKGFQNVNQLRRANLSILANQYQLDNMKDDISLNVANSYLQILFNREALTVAETQYEVTKNDLSRTKALVDNGVVPKGDLLEIEATAATQEQQIINAENGLLLSRISLAQLLLIEDYTNFDVADEHFLIPASTIMNNSADDIYQKALTVRKDIQLSTANVSLAEIDLKLAKGRMYPTLSAFYGYSTRASYQDIVVGATPNIDNPTRTIGTVEGTGANVVVPNFDPIAGGHLPVFEQFSNNDGHNFGLSLNVPILNGFAAKNNVKRRKITLEKAKQQLTQDKLGLSNKVYQAWNDARASLKAFEAAEKTLAARNEALKYARERFNVGLMNSFNFSQAQSRLERAQSDVIRTKYDYIFRLKVLEFYFGMPIDKIN